MIACDEERGEHLRAEGCRRGTGQRGDRVRPRVPAKLEDGAFCGVLHRGQRATGLGRERQQVRLHQTEDGHIFFCCRRRGVQHRHANSAVGRAHARVVCMGCAVLVDNRRVQ
jgi:hypothetical protein